MGERERIIERRLWVMNEKRTGRSLDEITKDWNAQFPTLSCSRSTIASDIRESLKKSVEDTQLSTLEWRQLQIERIEKVLSGKVFQASLDSGNLLAIDRFDKLINRLILLTGANAPTKIAATDPTGEFEVSMLSDEERAARVRKLFDVVRQRKVIIEAEKIMEEPE